MTTSNTPTEAEVKATFYKLMVDCVNWRKLWQDPSDGQLWLEDAPQGGYHGGGPPRFRRISHEQATDLFQFRGLSPYKTNDVFGPDSVGEK